MKKAVKQIRAEIEISKILFLERIETMDIAYLLAPKGRWVEQ
jgi:hypothetical protein